MSPARAGASAAQAREHLLELLAPLVAEAGYDLEDVTVSAAGRRSLVRVIVDADGGVDLDAVAKVSRIVSDTLDGDARGGPVLDGSYVLEVSSPGIDRPLTEPRHWRRAKGRLVNVEAAGKPITARIVSVDDSGATLEVAGKRRSVGWAELGRGKVQVEFNRSSDGNGED